MWYLRAALGRDSAKEENKFTVTGRGGLPLNPSETLQGEPVITNWVTLDQPVENRTEDGTSKNPASSVPAQTSVPKTEKYVEAQGWMLGENGKVILTAEASTVIPLSPLLTPAESCNAL